jgi:hypothetical protein
MSDKMRSDDALARIYLQPIAPPAILGLYAYAGSTLFISAIARHMGCWSR